MLDPNDVTIFDVAQAADVSITTVSRILNNKPDVSPATRQRVQQIIDELGFTPHAQARRLASRKSRTIALFFPLERAASQLELDFIVGATEAASEENFFFYFVTDPVTENSLLSLYRSSQIDGVILMEIHSQDWRVDLLCQNNYPFVMIGQCENNDGLSFVDLDFEQGIMTAFNHLVELGHRNIGFLNQSFAMRQKGYSPAVRSWVGYEKITQQHNLPQIYREVEIDTQALFEATVNLVAEQPQLTAIVATQGSPTVGVIRALHYIGRVVPDDFSVIGITTQKIADLITPPLTTIDFPAHTMGYQAAKMLINQLNKKPVTPTHILPAPQLIIRESTGPAKVAV